MRKVVAQAGSHRTGRGEFDQRIEEEQGPGRERAKPYDVYQFCWRIDQRWMVGLGIGVRYRNPARFSCRIQVIAFETRSCLYPD